MSYRDKKSENVATEYRRNSVRDEQRNLVDAYMARFKSSPLFIEAEAHKWDLPLMLYAMAVADVQAQMLAPNANGWIGWNGPEIFGAGEKIDDGNKRLFFAEQSRLTQYGHIDVAIPTGMIERWKKYA